MLAPICLFTYNRLQETKRTVEALKKNYLASGSDLFIFSDGPKSEDGVKKIEEVRHYLHSITGFKSVTLYESVKNRGLAESIITGASQIIAKYKKVIVLEDDLLSSPNFLNFMNMALDYYNNQKEIFSVSGYTMNLTSLKSWNKDYYVGLRASSWGWGTWEDRWEIVDWEVKDYHRFVIDPFEQFKFMRGGSDLPYMLWKQMNGKIDSWAIRWCYHQFKNGLLTVFPKESKIISIGFGHDATHTKDTKRFETNLDPGSQVSFTFENQISPEKELVKEFRRKFSIISRLRDKLIK